MAITAALVKELRERTGSGMMECKKALVETNGDVEAAIENMRKSGQAKAAKKAGRVAAEGLVVTQLSEDGSDAVMLEVNCETDFVAKDDNFKSFVDAVAKRVLETDVADVEALLAMPLHAGEDTTVNEAREALISKIGENMNVRRFVRFENVVGVGRYLHGGRIGAMVEIEAGNDDLNKDVAMHIAASNPLCISDDQVDSDLVEKERDIFRTRAIESGKPENIVDKIVDGQVRKFLSEITLLGQSFVKDPDMSIEKLLAQSDAKVKRFVRYELGEGIEKKQENFADEVAAQAASAKA